MLDRSPSLVPVYIAHRVEYLKLVNCHCSSRRRSVHTTSPTTNHGPINPVEKDRHRRREYLHHLYSTTTPNRTKASGRIGSAFAESLVKTGKHTVTGLTRGSPVPPGVHRKVVDYSSSESLISALSGQDFLIITLKARTPPSVEKDIITAASKAGIRYIMPSCFGNDLTHPGLCADDLVSGPKWELNRHIESLGCSWFVLLCGFWYQWSLASGEPAFGIDIKKRRATFFDEGKAFINTSTWEICGEAVAGMLSLPERGAEPSLQDFRNSVLPVASFRINQRGMLDSLHRVLGTTDQDWTIEYQNSKERHKKGIEDMKNGDFMGFARAMYTRNFFPDGAGEFETRHKLVNDVFDLPKEDLDTATREAVRMAEEGFTWQEYKRPTQP